MGMDDYTKHQQKIIKRYYENIDQISLQRLSELVADLYLASGKKRDKLWESAAACMKKLGLPQQRIDLVLDKKDPEMLARLVKELMGKE
jgi:soluble P-type ATPase